MTDTTTPGVEAILAELDLGRYASVDIKDLIPQCRDLHCGVFAPQQVVPVVLKRRGPFGRRPEVRTILIADLLQHGG